MDWNKILFCVVLSLEKRASKAGAEQVCPGQKLCLLGQLCYSVPAWQMDALANPITTPCVEPLLKPGPVLYSFHRQSHARE
jgi:hypothetical protein